MAIEFNKLTPVSDIGNLEIYKRALDFVFQDDEICNVAISGIYGAGKSSILESYKQQTQNKAKYLHISLAYFEQELSDPIQSERKNSENTEKSITNLLEGKIVNQLVHLIPSEQIPDTLLPIKPVIQKKFLILNVLASLAFLLSLSYLIFYQDYRDLFFNQFSEYLFQAYLNATGTLTFLAFSIALLVTCYFFYCIGYSISSKKSLKRIHLQGNEIELYANQECSFFDEHLNEVLYLFEHAGVDVFVFEDLDRYKDGLIFQRLREINNLLNKKKKTKTIRFFYLVRDDLFVSKDRTKFFDFIIPVVPVIDCSNSYEQIKRIFSQNNAETSEFDDKFLKEISYFIDDMRILKNIGNEYQIYKKQIANTEQNPNKLLAIVLYKNLFPKDFSDTHIGIGLVSTLFKNKYQWIEDAKRSLENQLSSIQQEIKFLENCIEISQQEANLLINSYYNYSVARESVNTRLNGIRKKNGEYRKDLEKQKAELMEKIAHYGNVKLKGIINEIGENRVFSVELVNDLGEKTSFLSVKRSDYFPLLKLLIKKGYIDESYPDYMTYFYQGKLTHQDVIFIRSIYENEPKALTYALSYPKNVIEELDVTDFKEKAIFNFELIECLIKHKDCFENKIKIFMSHLDNEAGVDFVINFLNQNRLPKDFLSILFDACPQFIQTILKSNSFSKSQVKRLVYLFFDLLKCDEILKINQDRVLTTWISSSEDFLNIAPLNNENFVSLLKALEVKFELVNIKDSNEELWQKVYEENLYNLSLAMISNILEWKIGDLNNCKSRHCNLSLIREHTSHLQEYLESDFSNYFNQMLEGASGDICDSSETVIHVLNRSDLIHTQKSRYIEALSTKIGAIEAISSDEIKRKLFNKNIVIPTYKNAACYFAISGKRLNNSQILFIKQIEKEFNDEDIREIDSVFENMELRNQFIKALSENQIVSLDHIQGVMEH